MRQTRHRTEQVERREETWIGTCASPSLTRMYEARPYPERPPPVVGRHASPTPPRPDPPLRCWNGRDPRRHHWMDGTNPGQGRDVLPEEDDVRRGPPQVLRGPVPDRRGGFHVLLATVRAQRRAV